MIPRVVLAAHQLRSVGPGQRYLMERRWLDNGDVMQRVNEGVADSERAWTKIGRWRDLEQERTAIAAQGWEIESR